MYKKEQIQCIEFCLISYPLKNLMVQFWYNSVNISSYFLQAKFRMARALLSSRIENMLTGKIGLPPKDRMCIRSSTFPDRTFPSNIKQEGSWKLPKWLLLTFWHHSTHSYKICQSRKDARCFVQFRLLSNFLFNILSYLPFVDFYHLR